MKPSDRVTKTDKQRIGNCSWCGSEFYKHSAPDGCNNGHRRMKKIHLFFTSPTYRRYLLSRKPRDSFFSYFMRNAGERERSTVFLGAARRATNDQREIMGLPPLPTNQDNTNLWKAFRTGTTIGPPHCTDSFIRPERHKRWMTTWLPSSWTQIRNAFVHMFVYRITFLLTISVTVSFISPSTNDE